MNIDRFKQEFSEYKGFRLAKESDSLMILNWRNSDHVRVYMHNPEIIPEQTHIGWFSKILISNSDLYFIYEVDNKPVGLVCFNKIADNSAAWGFYLGEQNMPKGTGTTMLKNALALAFDMLDIKKITATIEKENSKSHHLHKKLGFTEKNGFYEIIKKG